MYIENYEEEVARDLYLRSFFVSTKEESRLRQGPLTGIPNIDKPWLKYYTEEQIKAKPINKTAYQYLYDEKYQKNVLTKYRINYKIKASEEIYKAISGEIPTRVYSNKHGVTIHLRNSYLLCFLLY